MAPARRLAVATALAASATCCSAGSYNLTDVNGAGPRFDGVGAISGA
jgi:hypothetical protein